MMVYETVCSDKSPVLSVLYYLLTYLLTD